MVTKTKIFNLAESIPHDGSDYFHDHDFQIRGDEPPANCTIAVRRIH